MANFCHKERRKGGRTEGRRSGAQKGEINNRTAPPPPPPRVIMIMMKSSLVCGRLLLPSHPPLSALQLGGNSTLSPHSVTVCFTSLLVIFGQISSILGGIPGNAKALNNGPGIGVGEWKSPFSQSQYWQIGNRNPGRKSLWLSALWLSPGRNPLW